MWFFLITIALALLALVLFRSRQKSETPSRYQQRDMDTSTTIGVPSDGIDARETRAQRLAGVELPRISSVKRQDDEGKLASVNLRKRNISKEMELAWEAGEIIEFQTGAWPTSSDAMKSPPGEAETGRKVKSSRLVTEEDYSLPPRYDFDTLVLMARDPYWVYAYWEVTHEKYRKLYEKHIHEWGLSRPVLRIYDITPGQRTDTEMDIFLEEGADNWYLNIPRPRHTLVAKLGRIFPKNVFESLLTSNLVTLPADSPSEQICPEWVPFDWNSQYMDFRSKIGVSSPLIWGNNKND